MIKRLSVITLLIIAAILIGAMTIVYINPGPSVEQTKESEWLKTTPIAHRGLHTDNSAIPENSMLAFQKAIAAKYAIELDVHLSADGEVMVFHDVQLLRMTGLEKDINQLAMKDIQQLKLLQSDERIPRLADVLTLIKGQVPLLVEIKNKGDVGELEQKVIGLLTNYKGQYAVQAFNPYVLGYFKEHAPEMIRGQLSGSFAEEDLAFYKKILLKYLVLNGISAPHFVAYEFDVMPKWMANRLKAKNLYRLAWTVTTKEEAEKSSDRFDNLIFESFNP